MTFEEAENYIHSRMRVQTGGESSISKIKKLMTLLGNPQDTLKFIHISGTNGKGSTTKMSSSILQNAGYKVGMFISPFIVEFRERFQVNGEMISKEMFVDIAKKVFPLVDNLEHDGVYITEFQLVTAMGFEFFNRMDCNIVCLEVGIGGRLDVTNIINPPLLNIITSISLDHINILGDTIKQIAYEKAGTIKNNCSVVTYPLQDAEAILEIEKKVDETNSTLVIPNKSDIIIESCSLDGSKFKYCDENYELSLIGEHQVYNAVAVIEGIKLLNSKGFYISNEHITNSLKTVSFPARFEVIFNKPYIVVEGSHNVGSFQALSNNIRMINKTPKIIVMGMMADKDISTIMKNLCEVDTIITVPIDFIPRAIEPSKLAVFAREVCKDVCSFDNLEDGIQKALSLAGEDGLIVFCGSFYLSTNVRNHFKNLEAL